MSFQSRDFKDFPTVDSILQCITPQQIFEHYLGEIPRSIICSPLRDDSIPSFGMFHSTKYDQLFFKDFATGESGSCFVFVKLLFGYSEWKDVLNRVCDDFNLTQFEINREFTNPTGSIVKKKKPKHLFSRIQIQVKTRGWEKRDKEYWKDKYGISRKTLESCKVYPISHYFLNDYCVKAKGLAYVFVENKDNKVTIKVYQPYSEYKWINNNDASVWELWSQLPKKGDKLIITSSRKDAMVIKSLFPDYLVTSCSLQSEKTLPKTKIIDELKPRFTKDSIYVLYDNDFDKDTNWGREAGKKICEANNLIQIEIPEKYGKKDISDFMEEFGEKAARDLINKLIN